MERITFAASATLNGNTLSGTAHVFGAMANLGAGKTIETLAPGAFDAALQDPKTDVRAFWQHDPRWLLGRQSSGTLTLAATENGLDYSLELPDTTYAADLRALVARGDLTEMSFGFVPGKFTISKGENGERIRTHQQVASIYDISPVSVPAFEGTSLELRSKDSNDVESARSQALKIRHRSRNK
jgi:Escherichia/Staphylococcus phage prohead protease